MNLKSLFVSNNVFTILFPTTVKYDGSKNKRKKKKNEREKQSWKWLRDHMNTLYRYCIIDGSIDEWWWKTSIEYIQKLHGWHRMALQSDR